MTATAWVALYGFVAAVLCLCCGFIMGRLVERHGWSIADPFWAIRRDENEKTK